MPAAGPDIVAYFEKVDARLATVSAPTAREMIVSEIRRWERRYAEFCSRVDNCLPVPAGVTAFDYVETIAGLDQRAARLA